MATNVVLDAEQMARLLKAMHSLADPWWWKILTTMLPVFLAAFLAFLFGIRLEARKDRLDDEKAKSTRVEKERRAENDGLKAELSLMNQANLTIAFNVGVALHWIHQQILPHFCESHEANTAFSAFHNDPSKRHLFDEMISTVYGAMIRRCPDPNFRAIFLPRDLSFLMYKDANFLIASEWIETHARGLRSILQSRNERIDAFTSSGASMRSDPNGLRFHIETQVTISNVEVSTAYQLIDQLLKTSKKLEEIMLTSYKDVPLKKQVIIHPSSLDGDLEGLKKAVEAVAPSVMEVPPKP